MTEKIEAAELAALRVSFEELDRAHRVAVDELMAWEWYARLLPRVELVKEIDCWVAKLEFSTARGGTATEAVSNLCEKFKCDEIRSPGLRGKWRE